MRRTRRGSGGADGGAGRAASSSRQAETAGVRNVSQKRSDDGEQRRTTASNSTRRVNATVGLSETKRMYGGGESASLVSTLERGTEAVQRAVLILVIFLFFYFFLNSGCG